MTWLVVVMLYVVLTLYHVTILSKYVLTHTLDAVSHPAVSTAAFKASGDVDARGMHVAVMSLDLTFINIWRGVQIH